MEYLMSSEQMKKIDNYTINRVKIPSMVLMERAALAVSDKVRQLFSNKGYAVCVCGSGNNGADGLAVARQLCQSGWYVDVLEVGNKNHATPEYELQRKILSKFDVHFRRNVQFGEYDCIVDAIFGIGLSRDIEGTYNIIINAINSASNRKPSLKIVSVDIASGINATTGKIMNNAVKATDTVTFGYKKLGMALYPAREYCGNISVAQIGFFPAQKIKDCNTAAYTYTYEDLSALPERRAYANKGDCGKALIIAGSENMAGAACMSAQSALRSGCGLVKVFTHENNRSILLGRVPEAICQTYNDKNIDKKIEDELGKSLEWADVVVAGPGLSTCDLSKKIVKSVIASCEESSFKLVLDADALNIISDDKNAGRLLEKSLGDIVITPHIGEASRLMKEDISNIKNNPVESAKLLCEKSGAICVLKDAATVVCDKDRTYINMSGNCGMATAGSGDVLTGILCGMITAGFDSFFDAVAMAVYVHGLAGDICRKKFGMRSMKAWDITDALSDVLKEQAE